MLSANFTGEVHGGQLHLQQPLSEFEGQRVLVTLIVADSALSDLPAPGVNSNGGSPHAAPEAELLDDPGRIRDPDRSARNITAQVISVGRAVPRVYLEQD